MRGFTIALLAVLLGTGTVTLVSPAAGSSRVLSGCPAGTAEIPSRVRPDPGGALLVCKDAIAVVKTPDGTLHVIRPAACFIGRHGARLYFGRFPWSNAPTKTSSLGIVVVRRTSEHARADIEDGALHVLSAGVHVAVIGSAHLSDGLRRGSFTIVEHLGGGSKGDGRFTGRWDCGDQRGSVVTRPR